VDNILARASIPDIGQIRPGATTDAIDRVAFNAPILLKELLSPSMHFATQEDGRDAEKSTSTEDNYCRRHRMSDLNEKVDRQRWRSTFLFYIQITPMLLP
jgi:hypothetical protein